MRDRGKIGQADPMRALLDGCRTDEDMMPPFLTVKEPCNIGRMPSLPHGAWRFMPKGAVCLLALFLTFLPFVGIVTATDGFEVTSTVSIQPGYYCKLPFAMATDGVFEFDIEVRTGPNIDVILIPYSELSDYQNGDSFTYYPGGSFSDCNEAVAEVYLDSGTYCLILRNDGSSAASVHYSFTPTAIQGDSDTDDHLDDNYSSSVIAIVAFFIAVICLVWIYYAYGRKKDGTIGRERKQMDDGPRYCELCGSSVPDDALYCRKCGGRVR